ncbi:conserved hypothetical protein [Talaromyces stipitatus ATCC 10500]|uniref:N-acetyltransferase domain-containing protein n=1 Tax=Talaromyces stipitatus (strain ATCC 10500 / CBS 375.48 / QM 6759 / NRRL 1006) TaxID=441959 RepID=B8MTD5_TALSN|nr:uncharacterized protein TSTA_002460 [Talaromyces stipitatus ATCC 10500]EED12180.1 conserved hypothetical protein [Talaromyces stipitatus ATCC 10500]
MAIHLRPASEADLSIIVDVSTAAFPPSVDAIARHLFPGDLHYSEDVRQARIARKSVKFQMNSTRIMVAVDDASDGKIVGYSIWEVPVAGGDDKNDDDGEIILPPLAQEGSDRAPFMELRRILEDDVREQFGDEGTKGVWTLDSLGVHPNHQKRGIGRMLLDWGVEEAAKHGKGCYLVATPAGLPLYRAAGFEDVKVLDIFGTPHVSMRRRIFKVE